MYRSCLGECNSKARAPSAVERRPACGERAVKLVDERAGNADGNRGQGVSSPVRPLLPERPASAN